MTYYDYKVVPAPRRARKVKGISGASDLFALTLTETINEVARQGWEYYRSESLSIEAPAGWFRRATAEEQVLLVFRKPREHLSPRLAAVPETPAAAPRDLGEEALRPRAAERPVSERVPERVSERAPGVMRREAPGVTRREAPGRLEPRLGDEPPASATPLRAAPRLGPADQS